MGKVNFDEKAKQLAEEKQETKADIAAAADKVEPGLVWDEELDQGDTGDKPGDEKGDKGSLGDATKDEMYGRGSAYIMEMFDMGWSNLLAILTGKPIESFKAAPSQKDDTEKALELTLKYMNWDPKVSPVFQLIIAVIFAYLIPSGKVVAETIREKREAKKLTHNHRRPVVDSPADTQRAPTEGGNTNPAGDDSPPDSSKPSLDERICVNPECDNLTTNKFYCSHKCANRHSAAKRQEKDINDA